MLSQIKIDSAKNKILNDTLLAYAVLGIPIVGSSLIRTFQTGWTFLFTWHIIFVLVLWIIYFFKNHLALNVKVFTIVVLALFTGIYGAWNWGLFGGWQIVVITAPVLITVFFGRKSGIFILLIVACLLAVIAYLYITDQIGDRQDFSIESNSLFFWTNTIVTILLLMTPLIISIGKVQQLLTQTIKELTLNSLELSQAQKELSAAFDFIPVPVLIFNDKDEIIKINQRFYNLFGYNIEDLKNISDWFNKAFPDVGYRTKVIELWNKNCKEVKEIENKLQKCTLQVTSNAGKHLDVEIYFKSYQERIMAVFNDLSIQMQNLQEIRESELNLKKQNDQLLGVNEELLHNNDQITEMNQMLLRAKKKAEESDRNKTLFLQNMSHEIRTPLNAIIGFSELLNDDDLPKDQKKTYQEVVINSSNQLLDIINNILSVSSIESGKAVLIEERLNINEMFNSLIPAYDIKAKDEGIKLITNLSLKDKEGELVADWKKVKQVLVNLLDNAFKFTKKGKITVGYNLRSDFIVFYVKDTGIGIKSEYQQNIFERFNKGDNITAQKYTGTGLGLSISKSFVELMGGRIWLISEENKGATFFFTIPYKPFTEGIS